MLDSVVRSAVVDSGAQGRVRSRARRQGVAKVVAAGSGRRAAQAWHRGGSDWERWWLVRAVAVQGKN